MNSIGEKSKWMGKKLYHYELIDSTNSEAKHLARQGAPHGTLVLADNQSAGRGRRGRSWESKAGDSLLMSVILRPELEPAKASMVTLVQALAVRQAIWKETGLEAAIKWPNDLLLKEKKVCGILTEMEMKEGKTDFIIVGTGVNIKQKEFSSQLRIQATSLSLELGKEGIKAYSLAEKIALEFEAYYERFLETQDLSLLREEYNHFLINNNRQVRILDPGGEYEGKALGINEKGELIVETATGKLCYVYAGEVSVRGIEGYI